MSVGMKLTTVFAAGILVGLAVFKDDWDTQATKAEDFLGGALGRRVCAKRTDIRHAIIDLQR